MTHSVIEASFADVERGALLAPDTDLWDDVEAISIPLVPTPLESQPSAYVQTSWEDKPRGDIPDVGVKVVYTRDAIGIQLTWNQQAPGRSINDYNVYADACAVLFPEDGKAAELETMGSDDSPVVGWYWRAGTSDAFEITAHGIGTVERADEHGVRCASRWQDDRWRVVLTRDLDLSRPVLRNAFEVPVAFAVWNGSVAERAGLKSHSPDFHQLRLM